MGKPRFLVGLDVGSTKVCAIGAEVSSGGRVISLRAGVVPAQGIQRGAVVDLQAAVSAVARALNEIAGSRSRRVDGVILGISSPVASLNSRGTSGSLPGRPFSPRDAEQAIGAAAEAALSGGRQALHAIPRRFMVDGQTAASNPVGLFGRRLDADVHVVTAAAPTVRALIACVERWGAEVDEVVAQPLASAESILTTEERELGAVVSDVGAGSCGVTVFVDGSPWHTATVAVGGRHLTQDLAAVLGIGGDVAEELKLSAGHALASAIEPDEVVEMPVLDDSGVTQLLRREICEIIEARVLELIGLIGEEIQRSGYSGLLPGGLVLTGGTSQLPGLVGVAAGELHLRTRVGKPEAIGDVALSSVGLDGPAYASAAGLVMWGLRSPVRRWWTYPATVESQSQQTRRVFSFSRWWRELVPRTPGGEGTRRHRP